MPTRRKGDGLTGSALNMEVGTPRTWDPETITRCRETLESWNIEPEIIEALGVDVTPGQPSHLCWRIPTRLNINNH